MFFPTVPHFRDETSQSAASKHKTAHHPASDLQIPQIIRRNIDLQSMATVDPKRSTEDSRAIVITFRWPQDDVPVWLTTSFNDWQTVRMTKQVPDQDDGFIYSHTILVSKNWATLLYKFRIGDYEWVSDSSAPMGMYHVSFVAVLKAHLDLD